ncbi:MAG: hypothetical protein ACYDD7_12870 [Acidimicrobiales bacterium]
MTSQTFELIVQGAPPVVDVDRPDIASSLAVSHCDPSELALTTASVDALHASIADQRDPRFRAWAARVLCGESDGRRVPLALRDHAAALRASLAGWA